MLTAHECVRALAELRAATPLVTRGWRGPEAVTINTASLSVLLYLAGHGACWIGWASPRGRDLDAIAWPPALDGRLHDEIDAALSRAGLTGAVDRESFNEMPF